MSEDDISKNKVQNMRRDRSKQSLMGDLESIKSLLVEEDSDHLEDAEWAKRVQNRLAQQTAAAQPSKKDEDVPLFADESDGQIEEVAEPTVKPESEDTPILRGVEVSQTVDEEVSEPPTLTMAFKENPFLPKGVLDKLKNSDDESSNSAPTRGYSRNRNASSKEEEALKQVFHRWHDQLEHNAELVLQEVLDDYMPRIEAEMRRRLKKNLDDMIKSLINEQLKHRKEDF